MSYGEQMMCFCAILVMLGITLFCLPRLVWGPLPESVCWYQKFYNQSVPITTMLVFDAYYLARVSKYTYSPIILKMYNLFSTFTLWF